MFKAAPPLPREFLQRHRALCRPQSPSAKLGKYSGTESMLNPHLSQLHCFQGPIQTAQSELGMWEQSCHDGSANILFTQERKDSTNGHVYLLLSPSSTESKRLFQLWNRGQEGGTGEWEQERVVRATRKSHWNKISLKGCLELNVERDRSTNQKPNFTTENDGQQGLVSVQICRKISAHPTYTPHPLQQSQLSGDQSTRSALSSEPFGGTGQATMASIPAQPITGKPGKRCQGPWGLQRLGTPLPGTPLLPARSRVGEGCWWSSMKASCDTVPQWEETFVF